MQKDKEMTDDEYLKKHLSKVESKEDDIPNIQKPQIDNTRSSDLQFFNFNASELPCGIFYPAGTLIMVRPAQVREIQSYSMVDDNNFYDIIEKMNDMLQSCVRVKYTDGKMGSLIDIKDQDRLYLIFLIRELTFQQGNSLAVSSKCTCGNEVSLELKRENFRFHEIDSKLDKYFSARTRSYHFTTVNGKEFELTPPNIGLQKSFTEYIIKENNEKRTPNLAFLKIIPFMILGRVSITYEGIKSKLEEFENIDDISFQFLNGAVSKMTFGIKEIVKKCQCGMEVRTEMQFPNRASGIFVIHDAFEAFIKE
jgi:hypothetical protein